MESSENANISTQRIARKFVQLKKFIEIDKHCSKADPFSPICELIKLPHFSLNNNRNIGSFPSKLSMIFRSYSPFIPHIRMANRINWGNVHFINWIIKSFRTTLSINLIPRYFVQFFPLFPTKNRWNSVELTFKKSKNETSA